MKIKKISHKDFTQDKKVKNPLADEFLYICILIIFSFCVYDLLKEFL